MRSPGGRLGKRQYAGGFSNCAGLRDSTGDGSAARPWATIAYASTQIGHRGGRGGRSQIGWAQSQRCRDRAQKVLVFVGGMGPVARLVGRADHNGFDLPAAARPGAHTLIWTLPLGATSETAKAAEQAIAIIGLFLSGVVGGGILFAILHTICGRARHGRVWGAGDLFRLGRNSGPGRATAAWFRASHGRARYGVEVQTGGG